ncbi:hypothetical protein ABEB36_008260 [Hypothenemus hampei]|uniref:RGS domain-containing protein n=1 Tax=Hypothenemus hampei TaxID=57062 RepID=A0ABD1EL93_HYPHA
MLKFWRKSENKLQRNPEGRSSQDLSVENCGTVSPRPLPKSSDFLPLTILKDEDLETIDQYSVTKSKLCRTLEDTLIRKSALGYFIQYMEVRNASPFILCYLDIETFKADISGQTETVKSHSTNSLLVNKSDHDSLSVSTDCDSLTADLSGSYDITVSETKTPDPNATGDLSELTDFKEKVFATCNKNVETALVIFKKFIALEAKLSINCPDKIRSEVMVNICDLDKVAGGVCFDAVQKYLLDLMKNEYFNAYLETDFFSKHQIDVLTSGDVVLDDILYNETALFYFMEFLEQESKRSLLEFWIAATNLQQQLNDQKEFFDPIEAQNDAIVLYDKYFSLQAHCPLGFSDKIRFSLEQRICGENGLVIDCFSTPLKIVEHYLETNYLKPFLSSQLYYKYLSELINSVQDNGYSTSIEHKTYSPSDCSSERSFCTNTFLALELPQEKKNFKTNMSIDSRELYDPDALWKRKKAQRLSLGRVTELGQYVADIEPEPDKKGFNLKDVMKKIVSLEEEDKRKEEMAWKVAEMIVKDITSVTLGVNNL